MEIIQRGNPNIMQNIRKGAKAISESNGLAKPMFAQPVKKDSSPLSNNISEMFGGTNSNLVSNTVSVSQPVQRVSESKIDYESSMITRVLNTLDTLSDTKEYFNAIQDLMALYVSGKLNDRILARISDEDLNEIKGILNEFKDIIDNA